MVGEILKKFIGDWLMPLPILTVLMGIGCIYLWLRRERAARWLLTSVFFLLILFSCRIFTNLLIVPLENHYPKWDRNIAGIELIVVMGGSQSDGSRLPLTNRLNTASLYRLLEGIAIYRANVGSKLVLSGGGGYESNGELMAQVAQAVGVQSSDIIVQNKSRDTEEEVKLLKPIVEGHRFAVVTSAFHMPRTLSLFEAEGLQPFPAPTNFLDRDEPHSYWRDFLLPNVDSLGRAEFAAHEYLGMLWLKVKSLIQN